MKKSNWLFLLLMIPSLFVHAQQNGKYYTPKNFILLHAFFEQEKDLKNFFDLKPGEFIAGVGASKGYHEAALSMIYDSIHFYIEDIDSKITQKKVDKEVSRYTKQKVKPQTCTFKWVLGGYTSTNLPDNTFDKILMSASFHEFSDMKAMMDDIDKKLKPKGKLYVMEAFCIDKLIYCEDKHPGYYMRQVDSIMNLHGFYRTQINSPESKIINYANILVYERDQVASIKYFAKQSDLQPSIIKTLSLADSSVASDKESVEKIINDLKPMITDLCTHYTIYETWTRNIALKWNAKKKFAYTINILEGLVQLFPNSGINYFHLAQTYQMAGNINKADENYKKACELGYKNKGCK